MDDLQKNQSYEPISQKLLDTALKKIQRAVQGNGVAPEHVKIKSYEGRVHIFETRTVLKIEPTIARRQEPGKNSTATPLLNENDINSKVSARVHNIVTQRKVREDIIKSYIKTDKTKGFAAKSTRLPLEPLKHDYVLHKDCITCNKKGKIACPRCGTQGKKICEICHGNRKTICHSCNGQRYIYNGQQQKTCATCNSHGHVNCSHCHGQGTVRCINCKAQGYTLCTQCSCSGVISVINHIEGVAISHFESHEDSPLPQEIERYLINEKTRFEFSQNASITPIKKHDKEDELISSEVNSAQAAEQQASNKTQQLDSIHIPFEVKCPLAELTINLNGEEYSGQILGYRPLFNNFEPFIEKIAQKGIDTLEKAAQNKKNTQNDLKNACEYKLIEESLSLYLKNGMLNAYRQLKRLYPVGVSDKTLKSMLRLCGKAVAQISLAPRITASLLGTIIAICLYYALFAFGGEHLIPQDLWLNHPPLALFLSTLVQLAPLSITYILYIQIARLKLHKSLKPLVPDLERQKIKVRFGKLSLLILGGYLLSAVSIHLYAIPQEKWPLWFQQLAPFLPI